MVLRKEIKRRITNMTETEEIFLSIKKEDNAISFRKRIEMLEHVLKYSFNTDFLLLFNIKRMIKKLEKEKKKYSEELTIEVIKQLKILREIIENTEEQRKIHFSSMMRSVLSFIPFIGIIFFIMNYKKISTIISIFAVSFHISSLITTLGMILIYLL